MSTTTACVLLFWVHTTALICPHRKKHTHPDIPSENSISDNSAEQYTYEVNLVKKFNHCSVPIHFGLVSYNKHTNLENNGWTSKQQ